ncbi:hypothetical protein PIB30_095255 [Stylosanthes scabra]|uniref:Uncharacterized protein n=1 Tax=Stylosanthes scabra TaxID=79078 RepID=A0ABU6SW24_9FABA|nr:hypothetical protein [Stylosanthes scabra]
MIKVKLRSEPLYNNHRQVRFKTLVFLFSKARIDSGRRGIDSMEPFRELVAFGARNDSLKITNDAHASPPRRQLVVATSSSYVVAVRGASLPPLQLEKAATVAAYRFPWTMLIVNHVTICAKFFLQVLTNDNHQRFEEFALKARQQREQNEVRKFEDLLDS